MIQRRLLYLGTQSLSAYAWQGGRLVAERNFSFSPEDIARFTAYLQANSRSRFQILANVGDEGYQVEVIPFLQGKDRKALIARKTAQLFYGTPLSIAVSLGYEKSKRKNERLLLSALTKPAHFEPWLDCLDKAGVALAGIYTVSQLSGRLLKKLQPLPERCLVLTLQDYSIRQSYVVDGETLFSRMAPVADSSIAGIAAAFAAEAEKLHQYLIGQRQIGRSDVTPVFILAHPAAIHAVQAACVDTGTRVYAFLDNHQAAVKIGLRTPPQDSRSDLLFLHLLAVDAPAQQFADSDVRRDYRILQIKQALIGIGATALLMALLFSAKQLYDSSKLDDETAALETQQKTLKRSYDEVAATFPKLALDHDSVYRITSRFDDLARDQRQPGEAYRLLSRALDASAEIELDGIDWELVRHAESQKKADPKAIPPGAARESIIVRGTVKLGQEATPRQVMDVFEAFLRRLKANPGVLAEVRQSPVDIESRQALKGGGVEDEKPKPRSFSIQLTRPPAS